MIRVAIVEDEDIWADSLSEYLKRLGTGLPGPGYGLLSGQVLLLACNSAKKMSKIERAVPFYCSSRSAFSAFK